MVVVVLCFQIQSKQLFSINHHKNHLIYADRMLKFLYLCNLFQKITNGK